MGITLIVGTSILLQLGAAVTALWLTRITGRRVAWILIAMGLTLAAARQSVTLYRLSLVDGAAAPDLSAELLILVISAVMLSGLVLIVPASRSTRRLERVLAESEERYRTITENAYDLVCEIDAEGRFLYLSPNFREALGWESNELLGTSGFEQLHPDDVASAESELAKILGSGQASAVLRVRGRGGEWRWFECAGRSYHTAGGDLRAVVTARDVTEREQRQGHLSFLSAAVEQSSEGVAISDLQGTILFVNRAFAHSHGHSPNELVGRHLSLFHTPEQVPAVEAANRQIHETGEFSGEIWHLRRDGTVFPALMQNSLLRDREGRPVGMIGTLRDITERKQVEEELRRSQQRYRAIVEDQTELICRYLPDGTLTFANESYCRYFQKTSEELLGHSFMPLIPEEDRAEVRQHLASLDRDNPLATHEHRVVAPNGEIRWQQWANRAIVDVHGEVVEFQAVGRDVTERRLTEERLKKSERRFADIVENALALVWEVDSDGRYTYASPVAEKILGYEPEGLLTKHFYDLFHPEDREDLKRAAFQTFAERRSFRSFLNRNVHKSGKTVWLSTSGAPILDEGGSLLGYRGADIDVTDRMEAEEALRRAHDDLEQRVEERTADLTAANARLQHEITQRGLVEKALRDSEERLRTVVSASKDAMIAIGEDGLITLFNPAAEHMFGRSVHDMLGQPLDCLMPEEYREQHREHVKSYFSCGEPNWAIGKTVELPGVRSKGRQFPIELSLSVGQHGGKRLALAVIREITDRKQAEEALVTRLRYEEGLAACSRALLVDSDTEEALSDTLHQLQHASRVSRVYVFENFVDPVDGLCMRQTYEVCAPEVTPEIDNPLLQHLPYKSGFQRWQEKLSRGEPVGGEVRDFPVGEREILDSQDIHSILVLPIWSEGCWYGFVGFDDTQTDRLWTQEDIRLLQTAAEMIGAFIARQRAEAKLRQAKEAAEAASRAKSAFLANMSHEIRTPITATLAAAELLATRHPENSRGVDYVDVILRNGRHLLALINDLLELSRAEANRPEVRCVPCSLVDIIADVWAVTRPLHDRSAVDLRILYDTAVPLHIHTDPTRLKQAVINLVNNALKHTPTGHVWVRVAIPGDRPDPRLSISVEDTGIGIPAGDLERIFETFTQVKAGPTGVFGGVGLGLPLAKEIAERLGGTIEVRSVEGRGSTFTLRVATGPLDDTQWVTAEEMSLRGPSCLAASDARDAVSLRGDILLAEDFPDTRRLIEEALTSCGAAVVSVENGRDAVEAAIARPFDVILMDIRMPEMDGLEATAELRRRGCLIPIIALTASTAPGDRKRILDAGFDDLWAKPMTLDDLLEDVAAYLHSASDATSPEDGRTEGGYHISIAENPRLAAARAEFVRNLPARLSRITGAAGSGDARTVREALHQLVGSAGIHGFMALSREAARLLEVAETRSHFGAGKELEALGELVQQAVDSAPGEQGGGLTGTPTSTTQPAPAPPAQPCG